MPPRSKVMALPVKVRDELNRRLIDSGFGGYVELEAWLEEQGFEIGKSSIQRYGQDFEQRCEQLKAATEQAKAIVEAAPDDEGNMNEALLRLLQEKLLNVLQSTDFDVSKLKFKDIGILIARSARASVSNKKWAAEAKEKARMRLDALEQQTGKGAGKLDKETLRRVREEVYGIFE